MSNLYGHLRREKCLHSEERIDELRRPVEEIWKATRRQLECISHLDYTPYHPHVTVWPYCLPALVRGEHIALLDPSTAKAAQSAQCGSRQSRLSEKFKIIRSIIELVIRESGKI